MPSPSKDQMLYELSLNKNKTSQIPSAEESYDYRDSHKAPGPNKGAPMHDLKKVYPEDFYSKDGFGYYADQGLKHDKSSYNTIISAKNKPEKKVKIYRAVPKDIFDNAKKKGNPHDLLIKHGDWVTQSEDYAKDHGEGRLEGNYSIVSKSVPAKHLYTEGNSHHEWGYYPDKEDVKKLADGGNVNKTIAQIKAEKMLDNNQVGDAPIGVNEAVNLKDKSYMSTNPMQGHKPMEGGTLMPDIGGVDGIQLGQPTNQVGNQSNGMQQQVAQGQQNQMPQPLQQHAQQQMGGLPVAGQMENMLNLTPQGQKLNFMSNI